MKHLGVVNVIRFMLSVVCFAFVCLMASGASAQFLQIPSREAPDGGPIFPEFFFNGGGSGYIAQATLYAGRPIIIYDIVWIDRMGGLNSPGARFAHAHEYAHHRLGHTIAYLTTAPQFLVALDFQAELQADCWAVRALYEQGDEEAIQAGFLMYRGIVPPQDTGGKPGATRRTQNMRRCLDDVRN